MTIRIPIELVRRPGFEHVEDSFTSPVIRMVVESIPSVDIKGVVTPSIGRQLQVLIDTGADWCLIDDQVLRSIGAICMGSGAAMTKTLHGSVNHQEYGVRLRLPGLEEPITTRVSGLEIDDGTRAYQAILGMGMIQNGKLVIDSEGDSYLELRD